MRLGREERERLKLLVDQKVRQRPDVQQRPRAAGECWRGHDMSVHAHTRPDGKRYCKLCARIRAQEWRRERRLAA